MHAFIPTIPTTTPILLHPAQVTKTTAKTHSTTPASHPSPYPLQTPPPSLQPLPHSTPLPLSSTPPPTVVWMRTDLRLYDHPALYYSAQQSPIAPLYLMTHTSPSPFLLSSLRSLRNRLRSRGTDLYIRRSAPTPASIAAAVQAFCEEVRAGALAFGWGVHDHDLVTQHAVITALREMGIKTNGFWTCGLFEPEDLPYCLENLPRDCDAFAESIRNVRMRQPVRELGKVKGISGVDSGQLGEKAEEGSFGGEMSGMEWVNSFLKGGFAAVGGGGRVCTSFERIGPFLQVGCLSVRWVWWKVVRGESLKRYCAEWELLLHEFGRLCAIKGGGGTERYGAGLEKI